MRVIMVFFDTLRADHVGCYGYHKNTTPNVDRLAREGARFLNCYPTNVPTQPCYTSVLTGRSGISTGVVTHGQPESTISQEVRTFPEVLAEHGIIRNSARPVKLLGDGEASRAFTVTLSAVSKAADEKIKAAGGTVNVPGPAPKRGKYLKRSLRLEAAEK